MQIGPRKSDLRGCAPELTHFPSLWGGANPVGQTGQPQEPVGANSLETKNQQHTDIVGTVSR